MEALGISYEFLWGTALGVVPLVIAAAMVGAMLRQRPAARHVLWISVLASLVTPIALAVVGVPRLLDAGALLGTNHPIEEPRQVRRTGEAIAARPTGGLIDAPGSSLLTESVGTPHSADPVPSVRADRPVKRGVVQPSREAGLIGATDVGDALPVAPALTPASAGAGARDAVAVGATGAGEDRRSWRHAAGSAVEAVRAIPPMPRWLWAGGAAVFGLLLVRQLARLILIVRRGEIAPSETQAMVRGLSARMGLRRAPIALVVDRAISPMISCGLRPRVILPARLWDELDAGSREAVLVHELAHLRRRDHVVCWFETLLGVVYWWHPAVWWVRRRLHEDADLCCDAWVVSLFPRHRRAYAEALVATREFMGGGSARAVALGLGMASPRARRFSRRLSMVMTRRLSPRASGVGLLLAVSALGAGAMLTPAIACPPEDKGARKELIHLHDHAGHAVAALREAQAAQIAAGVSPGVRAGAGAIAALASVPRAGVASNSQPEHGRSVEERIARLESRVDRLLALLERGGGGSAGVAMPMPPMAPRAIAEWPIVEEAVAAPGETMERAYQLPEGKLDALWGLMARQDVPVFVSRGGDGSIIVQGDARQQRIFAAFVAMIHPEGSAAEGGAAAIGAGEFAIARERLAREHEEAAKRANEANALRGRAQNLDQQREIEMQRRAMHAERQALQRRIETMMRKAEQLFERSETLHERAEELNEAADEAEGERADQMRVQAEKLSKQAAELEEQAEAVEHEAEGLEEMLDEFDDRIEEIEDGAEEWDEGDDEEECEEADETEGKDERI